MDGLLPKPGGTDAADDDEEEEVDDNKFVTVVLLFEEDTTDLFIILCKNADCSAVGRVIVPTVDCPEDEEEETEEEGSAPSWPPPIVFPEEGGSMEVLVVEVDGTLFEPLYVGDVIADRATAEYDNPLLGVRKDGPV